MITGFRHPAAQAALALVALFVGKPAGRPAVPRASMPVAPRAQGQHLHRWLLWALAVAWAAAPASAQTAAPTAERRVALVVGNASYERVPLVNPLNDAADLSAALRRLGFEVLERSNRSPDQMRRDLADFQDKLGPGVVGLFYFAGHGVQAGRGLNYLLPVGVDYRRERDAELYGLEAGAVLRRMEEAGTALSLVILDACRDSPLPPEGRSSGSRGLGRMDAPSGSLVAFATASGRTADDNRSGRNGLYTRHLLAAIETPGLRVEDVFKRVRSAVERDTNRRQSPEEVSKLTADFYFINPAPPGPVAGTPRPAPLPAPPSGGGLSLADLEREQATRAQWADWQGRMQADFNRAASFTGSADLQAQAWQRFLQAWGQDNPTSGQDEQLRAQAQERLAQAQRAAQGAHVVPEPVRQPPLAVATAGRRAGEVVTDCAACPPMVFIPAGPFQMGSVDGDADEKPVRTVNVPAFLMGRTEVTQGQWKAVMGNNPSNFSACGDTCPVERVSWDDAQDFIRKLNAQTGQRYRLPSEAEWEYAARAGSTGRWSFGDNESQLGNHAWSQDNSGERNLFSANKPARTRPVAEKQPNAWGLFDMHGNVWEWVQDVWHPNFDGAPVDGSAWTSGGDQARRVIRGGSWGNTPQNLRSANREWVAPHGRDHFTGLRLARTL